MALTITVQPGYVAQANKAIYVADLNAGFLPSVTLAGSVSAGDIADGAVRINHLYAGFLAGAQAASAVAGSDLLLLGVSAGTANRSVTVDALLSGMWTSPAVVEQFDDWGSDRWLFQNEDGVVRAMAPAGLASSLVKQAPLASALGDYAANLLGVNGTSGATAMKVADFAKALITQAPAFVSPEALAVADEVLVNDVSTGKVSKTTVGNLVTAIGAIEEFHSAERAIPAAGAEVTEDHGLETAPRLVMAHLVYRGDDDEEGYKNGDVLPSATWIAHYADDKRTPWLLITADASKVRCRTALEANTLYCVNKLTGAVFPPTPAFLSAWRIRFYARK